MEIKISRSVTREELMKTSKVLRKFFFKKALVFPLIMLSLGTILIVSGYNKGTDMTIQSSRYNELIKEDLVTTTNYNYHILFGLGVGFVLTSLYYSWAMYRSNRKVEKQIYFNDIPILELNVVINIEDLYYKDFQSELKESWTVYSRYLISKNLLFVFRTGDFYNPIRIPLNGLSEDEKVELTRILDKRIKKY